MAYIVMANIIMACYPACPEPVTLVMAYQLWHINYGTQAYRSLACYLACPEPVTCSTLELDLCYIRLVLY